MESKSKTDEIYEYLLKHCVGKENRKKSNFFMEMFDIKNNETFRTYIKKIRYDNVNYRVRVESISGSNGGYYIARKGEKTDTVEKFKKRVARTAMTARTLEKTPLIGQLRIKISKLLGGGK